MARTYSVTTAHCEKLPPQKHSASAGIRFLLVTHSLAPVLMIFVCTLPVCTCPHRLRSHPAIHACSTLARAPGHTHATSAYTFTGTLRPFQPARLLSPWLTLHMDHIYAYIDERSLTAPDFRLLPPHLHSLYPFQKCSIPRPASVCSSMHALHSCMPSLLRPFHYLAWLTT